MVAEDKREDIVYEKCQMQEMTLGNEEKSLDEVLEKLGSPGPFLWKVFLLATLPGVFNIFHLTSYVFIGYELNHWCAIPELEKANWTQAEIRNVSGAFSATGQCDMYDLNYTHLASLPFDEAEDYVQTEKGKGKLGKVLCNHGYRYEQDTTIVYEWDLVCENTALRSTVQMAVALGKFLGALMFGFVADRWGRRQAYIQSCLLYLVSGAVASFTPSYVLFIIARVGLGMAGSGHYNTAFTLLSEVCTSKLRSFLGILYNMSYPVGLLILPLVAYLIPNWRMLQTALTVPMVILILFMWMVPESPRWLISQGRRKEAWEVVKKADKTIEIPESISIAVTPSENGHVESPKEASKSSTPTPWYKKMFSAFDELILLFGNGELLKRVLICYVMWCVAALTYFSLSLNADNFSADRYVYTAIAGAVEAVSYILPLPLLKYFGRRPVTGGLYILSGIALLALLAVPFEMSNVLMGVAMVGRLTIGAVYSVIVLYTSELFPTVNRNTAIGTSSTMSHVGSLTAPYLVDLLGARAWFIPSTVCGIVALFSGALCLLLPETKDRELCDTVEEINQKYPDDKVSVTNCCKC